jgi:hypothetical protein
MRERAGEGIAPLARSIGPKIMRCAARVGFGWESVRLLADVSGAEADHPAP